MTKDLRWDRQTERNKLAAAFNRGTSLRARYRRGGVEPEPEPHDIDFKDSRGRPISLPKVSILERDK